MSIQLGICVSSVRTLIRNGELRAVRVGHLFRISPVEFYDYISKRALSTSK